MMSSKQTLIAIGLVSTSALAITTLTLRNRDDGKRAAQLEKRIDELSELVESRSAGRVEEHRTIVETRVPAVPAASIPVPEVEALTEEARAANDAEEPEPPSTEDKAAYAQSVFDTEPIDAGWAAPTKKELDTSLGQYLGASTLAGLECKSALCRAEIQHANGAELQQFLDGVLQHSHDVWRGPMAIYQVEAGDDGRVVQNLYFAREGTRLPRL